MRLRLPLLSLLFLGLATRGLAEDEDNAVWRRTFDRIAARYELTRPEAKEGEKFPLVDRATYTWSRSGPQGGTYGAVYVWTDRGNAAAVACLWRDPYTNGRLSICHELHSLASVAIESHGTVAADWKPKGGVKRIPLPDAPIPAETAVGRMSQMRTLCRDFAAWSEGAAGDRTELRLLPQPLYRFQSTNPDVVDGGLFAFVCSVGTDPEIFLQLEAIRTSEGPRWHAVLGRFSHMNLFVRFQDKELWRAIRDQENPISHNADHSYWVFHVPFDRSELDPPEKK